MGLTTERRQKKESVNLKLKQQKLPHLIKREKINRKEGGGGRKGEEREEEDDDDDDNRTTTATRELGN